MPSNIAVQTEERGQALIVRLVGDAGMANVDALERALTRVCAMKPKLAVVDMSQLSFISSIGMGTLVTFMRGVERCGGTVVVAALQPMISDAFKRARLNDVLKIRPTVDEAIGGDSKPAS